MENQFNYFELKYSVFDKNKKILNYLSDFSFLIFIGIKKEEKKGKEKKEKKEKKEEKDEKENIFIYFNQTTYNCKNNNAKYEIKFSKKDIITQIYFCYSSIPLAIKKIT